MVAREEPSPGVVLRKAESALNPKDGNQEKKDHIGVCICTYKRPRLLAPLLEKLELQKTGGTFHFSLHIVDNDLMKSAEETVAAFARSVKIPVTYDNEPVQNIALARNRAVRAAEGNILAFLDDDEIPGDEWLMQLYLSFQKHNVAGVLGPVKPFFPPEAPAWLIKSRLCDRPSHVSGAVLNFRQTRTGNVLLDRRIIRTTDTPFPPETGRTGGEDTEFFRTMMARGHTFIWCEAAPLYEIVLPERFKRMYHIKQSLRIGGLTGEKIKAMGPGKSVLIILLSGCAAVGYGFLSVAGILLGHHVFIRNFTKTAYFLARIAGWFGFVPYRERQDP